MSEIENTDDQGHEPVEDLSEGSCGGQSDEGCCCSGDSRMRSLKKAIFVLVLLAACAVAGHSLLASKTQTPEASDQAGFSIEKANPAVSVCPTATACPTGGKAFVENESVCPAGEKVQVAAVVESQPQLGAISCGITLDSINSVGKIAMAKGAEVVFIFLTGENEELAKSSSAQIETAVDKLTGQGKKIAVFTLRKDSEGHDELIKDLQVVSLPAVVVSGRGAGAAAVSDGITETKLLSAFVKVSAGMSCGSGSCGPKSGSGCSPK